MRYRTRLRGNGEASSQLFQLWTTVRLRLFIKLGAAKLKMNQSELVRTAVWEYLQKNLDSKSISRFEREATTEETRLTIEARKANQT